MKDLDFMRRHATGWFVVASLLILLFLLSHTPDHALLTNDASLGGMKNLHEMIIHGRLAEWDPEYWLGNPGAVINPSINLPILGLVPVPYGTTVLLAAGYFLGGLAMFLLLRNLGLSLIACFFGGLAMLLANTVFTLAYPGHLNKVYSHPWLIFACLFFLKGLQNLRLKNFAISGAFLGISVLSGEFQLAFYLGLWFLAWTLCIIFQKRHSDNLHSKVGRYAAAILLLVGITLVVSFQTMEGILGVVGSTTSVAGEGGPASNWAFATQFYFPPEELLSYLTTIQFFGGPHVYWGRDGNPTPLRLSDDYMGLLPLGFAILGGIVCWRIWKARLFIMMAVFSLLISFGREGGLYWLLYQLPTMKSQRNPHRWSYFVSLAVCVLAAYGVDWLWGQLRSRLNAQGSTSDPSSSWAKWRKYLGWVALGGGILFMFGGFMLMNSPQAAQGIYSPSQLMSPQRGLFLERTRMLLASLTRTGLFLSLSAGSVWWVIRTSIERRASNVERHASFAWFSWGVVLLVMVLDLGINARRYLIFYRWRDYLNNNGLANLLRKDPDSYRVKIFGIQQNPFLNDLAVNILPFYHIPMVDIPTLIRLPEDYGRLFDYIGNHPIRTDRYLDFFNVKYVVSPGMVSDPYVSFKYLADWQGTHVYLRNDFLPRAWMANSFKVVNEGDEAVLSAVFHPALNPRETVVLMEKPTILSFSGLPPSVASREKPSCQIVLHEDNHIEVETASKAPSMLVLDEKWDPDWKAWLDGKPVKIYKANFLMRGVEVPPGNHRVRMEYRPSTLPFWVSSVSILIFCLVGFVSLLKSKTEANSSTGSQ